MSKYWWRDEEDEEKKDKSPKDKEQKTSPSKYWWRADSAKTASEEISDRVNTWLNNHNTYISNYKYRYGNRKFDYGDDYVSDSGSWLDTVTQQKSAFDAEADSILSYMDQYKDYFNTDWMDSVRKTLTSAREQQGNVITGATNDNKWWNSFGSEELVNQFGSAEEAYKYYQRSDGYDKKWQGSSLDEIMAALNAMEDGEEKDWLAYNQASIVKNTLSKNEDFADRSKYNTTYRGGEKFNSWTGMYTDTGFDDLTYDYINKNETAKGRMMVNDIATNASFLGLDTSYLQEMTDDEIAIYNYLYDPNDKSAAEAYLAHILSDLNYRQRARQAESWAAYAQEHPILSSVFSVMTSPLKTLTALGQFADYMGDGTVDQNAGYNKFSYIPSTIRNQVASDIEKSGKWGDVGSWTYQLGMSMGDFLMNTAVSGGNAVLSSALMGSGAMADTVISAKDRGLSDDQAMILGVVAGAAELVTEKFSLDALLKGNPSKGAMRYILTNTLTEGSEEVASSLINTIADVIVSKDKSEWEMAIQAYLEEHPDATEDKAFWNVLVDNALSLGLDFLGGAIMGGTMGTGGAVINYATNTRPGLQVNKDALKDYGDKTDALIQEGLANDKKSDSYKLATKYQQQVHGKDGKQGKAMTGAQIRNLLAANQEQVTKADIEKIQNAAANRLVKAGQREDIYKIAELATKYATGQEMTRAERSTLARSKFGSQVASELLDGIHPDKLLSKWENDMSEGWGDDYSTDWTGEIGTESNQFLRYNSKKLVRRLLDAIAEEHATYKPLEERVGKETSFKVAKDGQDTITASGKAIDLSNVKVVDFVRDEETGEVVDMILDANGEKVKASGISYADDSKAYLFEAVGKIENITPEDATVVIRDYKNASGLTVSEYLNGVDEGFTYGYHGYSEADLKAGNFATKLSDTQANSAYVLGQNTAKNKSDYKDDTYKEMRTAAQAETEKAMAEGKEAPKAKNLTVTYNRGNGEVVSFDEAFKDGELGEKRSGAVSVAKILHKMGLGTRVEFFTSYLSDTMMVKNRKTGKMEKARVFINDQGEEQIAYSGVHRQSDGTIRVDLEAYNGRGLTLNALAHELTHFIQQWSTKKYKVLVDFLMQEYEKTDMTMHKRVLAEQNRLQKIRGKKVSYNEAYDEVVANAMSKMFDDGNLVEKLTKLKAQDKNLAQKLWEGFKNIMSKFLGIYQNESALFKDAADLVAMKDTFEQLQNMFAEALVEASDNYQASIITKEAGMEFVAVKDVSQYSYSSLAEAAGFEAVQNEDGTRSFTRDGKKVSKVTVEDIDNSPIGAFINFSLEMGDISEADSKRQKEMFAKICTMACKTNDFAMTMQFVGSAVFTGMKANADKQYGTTYDFPSICTKTQAVIDAMSAKMVSLERGLNTDEIVQLYDDVFASGNPVPCPECYVFSRWIGIGGLLDNIKKYQDYYGDMAVEDVADAYRKMKAEVSKFADEQGISFGKAKGALTSKLTKEFNKLTEKIEKAQNQGEKMKPADQKRLEELEPMMNTVKAMTWLENVYFADSSLKKVNPKFRVPNDVLFDLNNGEAFATQYKDAWAFRTTQGAGYGKAITPYAEARLGEGVLVTNNTTNAIKGKAQGSLNNYFLNQMGKLDKQSRDALKKARMKQKIQAFIGGQRFQSTSDARYENASDYLLAALEMQAMGGMVQAYTKVDGAVPAFSAWGFSINQSLMPLNGGLDADGNVKDTAVGGMNPKVAFDNRKKHESAGTITIGVNDNHIRAMFKQWVRDFIIPYHASGGKADVVAEFRRIQEGKEAKGKAVRSTDYSRTQSDKILSDEVLRWQGKTDAQIQRIHEIRDARIAILTGGKVNMTVVRSNRFLSALYDKLNGGEWDGVKLAKSKVESQIFPNEFWDQTVTYDESAKITKDYLEYCEDLGFLHRFSGVVPSNGKLVPVNGYNENGERVQLTDLAYKYDETGNKTAEVEEFFWKVLTDRRMYDNNGNYLPQKVVTLNDTTAETVTNFAKNNQGRQYDKAKAEALANKILKGEQYSSHDTDIDNFDFADYPSVKLSSAERRRLESEAMTWNGDKIGKVLYHDLSNNYTYVYYIDKDHNIIVLNKFKTVNIHERQGAIDDKRNRAKVDRNNGEPGSKGRIDTSSVFSTDRKTTSRSDQSSGKAQPETRTSDRGGYAEGASDTDKAGVKEQYSSHETDYSNRDLLANAFEGITKSSAEYKLIQNYKGHIRLLNEYEAKLSKINAQIHEMRFTEGKYDAKKLAQLEAEAKNTTKEINKHDRKLLSLEASEPLRKLIEQERKKEAEKTKAHVNEIQQNKKVRAEQAEYRHKIRKAIRDLDKLLNRGNKKLNVKEDMQNVVTKALKAADILFTDNYNTYDMLRNGIGADLSDAEEALVATCTKMLKDLDKMPIDGYDNWQARQEAENRLKTKMSNLKEVFARERKRLANAEVSGILGELASAYAAMRDSEQSYVQGAYSEPVYNFLVSLQSEVGGTLVRDMTKNQLESVYAAYKMVLESVRNANKMFNEELKQSREQLGNAVINEVLNAGGVHGLWTEAEIKASRASWNNMKPIWVANRIGSDTFGKLMNGLFKGQYKFAVDISEAKQFKLDMDKQFNPREWDTEKQYKFTSSTGKEFSLNLQQIMSLYAFSKREQAYSHLLNGGFVFEDNSTVIVDGKLGIKKTYIHKGATSYKLNEATLNGIINSLTAEQKAYVDEMQKYLSETMGAKGNEVSMKLYGIQMFKEKFYFPLRSSGAYMERAKEAEMKKQQGQINLVNSGFTHSVKPEAKNPIILSGFMDVWAEHCNEMSMYHSMVLPMEDFRKVYNYTTVHDEKFDSASVFQTIKDAYGDAATNYIDQLYRELNAGATIDPRETDFMARISKFKKAAVMLSGSVVVQQFSSIGRAYAIIDPKYFVGTKVNSDTNLSTAEEMKKYAPVAIIKEMGGFDTGTKGSAKSYITAEQYSKGERFKGFKTDKQYRNDIMGYLPAKADEITWCAIWEATKRETKANNPNMDVKSEEFLKLAGERFSEVIEKTQVYDSVLARSANMRSKSGLMQMATAFMAEPTTTINLIEDALRNGNKKYIARVFGAVAVSIILNNALASIVYAMRDDDEDETFIEKYFQSFTSGMIDDINPMSYYPFLKDVWSLFQGYDVERSDMSVIADVRDATKQLYKYISEDTTDMDDDKIAEHNKNLWGAFGSMLDAVCSAFGVPVKNVRRDANGIINAWNTIGKDLSDERDNSWLSFWDKVGSAAKDTIPIYAWTKDKAKTDKLYDAIMAGDDAYLSRLKSTYKKEESYHNAVRKALRENDSRIKEAAQAQINGDPSERVRIAKLIIADGFDQDDVVMAINAEINAMTKSESDSDTTKVKGLYKTEDFVREFANGDVTSLDVIRDDILDTEQKNGKTLEAAEDYFASGVRSEAKDAYLGGSLDDATAKKLLVEYAGMDEEDAVSRVDYWSFCKNNPEYADDLAESDVNKYKEFAEPADIPVDVYAQFINGTKGLTDKLDKWGDVEVSKQDQVIAVIDSLPLTWQQKDALFLAYGYKESSLWKVSW